METGQAKESSESQPAGGAAAVDAMEAHTGTCPGLRRAHARGIFALGEFQASGEAARLSRAAHFQGEAIPCLLRFSNASGNPRAPDLASAKVGRVLGLGVRFSLPTGGFATWAAATIQTFPARNLEDFVSITKVQKPNGTPHVLRLIWHIATHLHTLPALKAIGSLAPLSSFAEATYSGVHTYFLLDHAGNRKPFRYTWVPQGDPASAAPSSKPHFLLSELRERLSRKPIAFDLVATFPAPGDPLDDATIAWPENRETVRLGTLRVTSIHPAPAEVDGTVFDPTGVPPGIELSSDPILRLRAEAYGVSHSRRTSEPNPGVLPSELTD